MSALRFSGPFEVIRLLAGPQGDPGVFVCYLDDSDNDKGDNLCLAGYYAHVSQWLAFEAAVAPIFARHGVSVMRGLDLFHGRKDFKDWEGPAKFAFVEEVFSLANKYVLEGVSTVVSKSWFREIKRRERTLKSVSPLGLAFSSVVASLAVHSPVSQHINQGGLSFIVESGNSNNGNIERFFHRLKQQGLVGLQQGSTLTFADKASSRALMMADMLAFHSRRAADLSDPNIYPRKFDDSNPAFQIMRKHLWHRFNHLWDSPHTTKKDNLADQSALAVIFDKFG